VFDGILLCDRIMWVNSGILRIPSDNKELIILDANCWQPTCLYHIKLF
jgi:hypothetical protein